MQHGKKRCARSSVTPPGPGQCGTKMSEQIQHLCGCGCGNATPIYAYTHRPRGRIKGQHARFLRGHNQRGITCEITPKAVHHPSAKEIAWAAGFLEGEGNFYRQNRNRCRVAAPQKQREPLDRLQAYFGGTIRLRRAGSGNPIFDWTVCGARARGVAMTVYSFMSPRRKSQIRRMLNYAAA